MSIGYFSKLFPDYSIARKFSSRCTKTVAIVKDALVPHYLNKVLSSMSNSSSMMMDDSTDWTEKSYIILARNVESQKMEKLQAVFLTCS